MSSQWSHRNLRDKMFKSRHIVVSTFPHILRLTYLFDFQFLPRFCLWQQTFSIIKPWKCHIIFDSNALTSTSSLFQSSSKELQPVHPKGNQSWIFIGRSDAEAETPTLWPPDLKRPWCWERLKAGEGDNRGWDGWMALLTWWTWVWVNSGSWWWTGKPAVLQTMGLQRVGHDWATELNWIGS